MLAHSLLLLAAVLPQDDGWRIAPAPEWLAAPLTPPAAATLAGTSEPLRWLVTETQLDLRGDEPERYTRFVHALVDEVDVREGSQVSIQFDPAYEEVLLHSLFVERADKGGPRRIDQLAPERFSLLRREGGLETQVLDGTHTLVAWLDDVRKGDRVELSYTVRGANPVFEGHAMDAFLLRWQVAVGRWRHRVLAPFTRTLYHRGIGAGHADLSQPVAIAHEGWNELVWEGADAPPVPYEDALPAGFDSVPWVQLTDFASWDEVVRWAAPLYAPSEVGPGDEAGEELRAVADEIRGQYEIPFERLLAALRWVQDEVRYLGVELGPRSHRPSAPELVLQRRFGDCKDKSLLLAGLLRELELEAVPALVSVGRMGRVDELLPSILAFDHVIVRARVGGRELWLDPTRMHQRPRIEALVQAPFGSALPIAPDLEGLVAVPALTAPAPETAIQVKIDARKAVATMEVTSEYRGKEADHRRSGLRSIAREELGRQCLNYYAQLFPGIEQRAPPSIDEDEALGRIVLRESYRVPGFWGKGGEERSVSIEPLELSSLLIEPSVRVRTSPIALAHPMHVSYSVEVVWARPWSVPSASKAIDGPGVSLHSEVGSSGNTLRMEWTYRTIAPEVPPQEVAAYVDWLAQARDDLFWNLSPPDAPGSSDEDLDLWIGLAIFLCPMALVLALGVGLVLWLVNPGKTPEAQPVYGPVGRGGLCALLGFSIAAAPLVALVMVVRQAIALGRSSKAAAADADASSEVSSFLLLLDLSLWLVVLGAGAVLAAAFLARKRFFPPAVVGLMAVAVAMVPIELLQEWASDTPLRVVRHAGASFGAIGCAIYVLRSRRVRNTFVR